MEFKISELVAKSGTPKSTILYYIKEGLLPKAKKLKSNVHRYNDEHLELIKYIKYMKEEMGSTNEHIKIALKQKNNSFSSSYTMLAPLMQTLSSIPVNSQHFCKKEFIEYFDIDEVLLEELLQERILMPLSEDDFTQKEASVITLIENFKEVGVDYEILKEYVKQATKLAELELQMQKQLCDKKDEANFSTLWKIMFDTLFNTKEYIFNRSTYKVLYRTLKDELDNK
ncbi:MerR family transcriptional regulator [Sulfurimonas aquatica]|uniref:MerR family transcriptional regulator n=1 Tax=Sulfurimonas aquatica TaxID=2672570 RepID=A0A975GDQ3_9BACT|nr:MerR family transcriptional regulator [Sulfurimonas aquatica]QSZ42966.1 MerR family transcriptional regulator [Sulfurimonas aquatica]